METKHLIEILRMHILQLMIICFLLCSIIVSIILIRPLNWFPIGISGQMHSLITKRVLKSVPQDSVKEYFYSIILNGQSEYEGLVRSLNFKYDTNTEEDFTFIKSIKSIGYIKKTKWFILFLKSYRLWSLNTISMIGIKQLLSIDSEDLVHAPSGLDEQQNQFTDLFNEGLSGILSEQAGGWYYKHNIGNGKFEQAKLVSPPSLPLLA